MNEILNIEEVVKKFILKTSYLTEDKITNDTLIFAEGIMDSMGFLAIIDFLEETFSVKISEEELLESNFESINAINNFIKNKMEPNE